MEAPEMKDPVRRDLEAAFSSPEGERVLRWLCGLYGIWRPMPPHETEDLHYRLGQQSVILHIIEALGRPIDPLSQLQEMARQHEDYVPRELR